MNLEDNDDFKYESADKVQLAFYKAFSEGDIHVMKNIFADEHVSYTHPETSTIIGRQDVVDYWALILTGINRTIINRTILNKSCNEDTEVHLVSETFIIPEKGSKVSETITTNVFIKQTDGWRLQMQHASSSYIIDSSTAPNFDRTVMSSHVSKTIN